jgi:hypothetical protein
MDGTPNLSQRLSWKQNGAIKRFAGYLKITQVESNDPMSIAIHCGFQDHVIIRIGQTGPPPKSNLDGLSNGGKIIQHSTDFGFAYSAYRQVFRTRKYSLILQNQRH